MAGTRDTLGSLSYCPACARAQDLGAGNFGGKGGDALREAPPTPPHRPPPSATRRLGSPECPRCPGLAPPCAGVYSWSRGFGGPAAGTRIRGALWTPRARGPRLHSGLGQGAPVCALLAATLGPGPGVWKPRCEPRACAHPRVGGGRLSPPVRPTASGRVPAPCSRSLALDAAGFGAFPALLRRTCYGNCGRLVFPSHSGPLHCLSRLYSCLGREAGALV